MIQEKSDENDKKQGAKMFRFTGGDRRLLVRGLAKLGQALMAQQSTIPEGHDVEWEMLENDRLQVWQLMELLDDEG